MTLFPDSPPTANDLAKVMGCTRQNVKEILTSLEKKGFVTLIPSESDKRKRIVTLTEKAMLTASKYSDKENEFLQRLYDGVTEEQIITTYRFLSKIEDNLKIINEELKNENNSNL